MTLDTAPEWQLNRLRFSLAHEIGHWSLHRELFAEAQIENFESLLEWLNSHEGRKDQIEREANEFAGRLLVPIEPLTQYFEALAKGLDALHGPHGWTGDEKLRKNTCELLGQKFGIHSQGISVRLDREKLWPSNY